MLIHSRTPNHAAAGNPGWDWDGREAGEASNGQAYAPLSVQQGVPNIGVQQTAPQTKVNPTHEQGDGRSPGWRSGWMRKNIPYNRVAPSHSQRHYGALRVEHPIGFAHPIGSGPGQTVTEHRGRRPAMVLPQPESVYYTAQPSVAVGGVSPLSGFEPV